MEKLRTGRNSPVLLRIAKSQLVLPALSPLRKSEQVLSPRGEMKRPDFGKFRGWKTDRSALSPGLPSLSCPTLSLLLHHSQPGFTHAGLPHTNQDALFLHQRENCYVLGVCDGHGTWGHEVAQRLAQLLPKELYESLEESGRSQNEVRNTLEIAMKRAASTVEAIDVDLSSSGCTCTCVLVLNRAIYCANVGDSRAVLGRKSCGIWSVCHLSWDHKPEDPAERQRILDCGGEVAAGRMGTMRVYVKNEGFPGLAMSRSVGDLVATTVGVTADPDVNFLRLSPTDKFFLIASDGLWDVVPSIEAVALVGTYLDQGQSSKSLQALVHLAQSRWLKRGRADDISVILGFISA